MRSVVIQFPDGSRVDTSNIQNYYPASSLSAPVITFAPTDGGVAFTYTCTSFQEQIDILYRVIQAFKSDQGFLELYSFAGLPTNGSAAAGDMFLNGAAAALGVSVSGNQRVYLTLGTDSTTPAWPLTPFSGGSNLVKSFQPDGQVTIGTTKVNNLIYVNGATMQFFTPPMPAGTYSLTYTDSRGSVTVAAIITYS